MTTHKEPLDAQMEHFILSAVRDLDYGSVAITIHDSRVVQIEKSVKKRFDR